MLCCPPMAPCIRPVATGVVKSATVWPRASGFLRNRSTRRTCISSSLTSLSTAAIDIFDTHMAAVDKDGEVYVSGNAFNGRLGLGKQDAKFVFHYLQQRRSSEVKTQYGYLTKVQRKDLLGPLTHPFVKERVLMVACGDRCIQVICLQSWPAKPSYRTYVRPHYCVWCLALLVFTGSLHLGILGTQPCV